jgi:hypothetical protein
MLQLIEGQFNKNETLTMITQMFEVKIKFHENKIMSSHNEEDIKSRENKIKRLQKTLHEFRLFLNTKSNDIKINSAIHIE